jgi:D-threo-aldose 1-dehydrogenase
LPTTSPLPTPGQRDVAAAGASGGDEPSRATRAGRALTFRAPLSRVGLGTAPLGGLYKAVSDEQAEAVIGRAWALGLRLFDTAPLYGSGLAERRLGAALRSRPREEFAVSTKVGRLLRAGEPDPIFKGAPALAPVFDFSYEGALRSLEESLERLGLDRVDIALVHDPDDHFADALTGACAALERLRDEGVVHAIGIGMNRSGLLARFARQIDVDCLLLAGRYTLLDRSAQDELLPLCEERGITVIAAGVFNSGILADGETFDYAPAAAAVRQRVAKLREICARWQTPLAAAAVQFPGRHPAVASVLVGCRSVEEVTDDAHLFSLELPAGLWHELEPA